MHMHMLFGVVLHTTVLAVVGYALLFSATRTAGIVALIGRILGIWLFVLAALSVVAFFVAAPGMPEGPPRWMFHHGPGGPGMPPPPPAMQPQQPPPPPAKP